MVSTVEESLPVWSRGMSRRDPNPSPGTRRCEGEKDCYDRGVTTIDTPRRGKGEPKRLRRTGVGGNIHRRNNLTEVNRSKSHGKG